MTARLKVQQQSEAKAFHLNFASIKSNPDFPSVVEIHRVAVLALRCKIGVPTFSIGNFE
jgi:hypothetical protein